MDEVGKHVSAEYAPNVAFFLKQYSQQLGRQIMLITHNEALAAVADKAFKVTLNSREETEVRAV
jgi:DNA repair ATPase RecN